MVERRNAVALVGGVVSIIFIYFFILPALGVNIPNPFQSHAVVTIAPNECTIAMCAMYPQNVIITFHRPFQGKIISSVTQTPSTIPLSTVPTSTTGGVCRWTPWLPPGGDFKYILEIPELGYRRVIHQKIESTPIDIDFTGISMEIGKNYQYKFRIWWAPTDSQCLYKEGLGSI